VELPNYYKKYNIREVRYNDKGRTPYVLVDTADNFYIQILSELGIIGLVFFLWIFYLIVRQVFILFLFGIHILHFEIQLVFWLAVGILFSLTSEGEKKRDRSPLKKEFVVFLVILFKEFVVFLVILFTAFHVWGNFRDLSLKERSEEFNLKSNFGFYEQEMMQQRSFRWTKKKRD